MSVDCALRSLDKFHIDLKTLTLVNKQLPFATYTKVYSKSNFSLKFHIIPSTHSIYHML